MTEVLKEKEVYKESKVSKVFQDRMEPTVQMVLQEKEVHRENKVSKVFQDRTVSTVQMVLMEQMALAVGI